MISSVSFSSTKFGVGGIGSYLIEQQLGFLYFI